MSEHYRSRFAGGSAALVDLASVPDGDHEDEKDLVVDLIDDPVAACPYSPFTLAADQACGA